MVPGLASSTIRNDTSGIIIRIQAGRYTDLAMIVSCDIYNLMCVF